MPTVRTIRLVNPHKKHKKVSRRPRRKRNMGGGELFVMTNPKKHRSSRRRSRHYRANRRHRRNPFMGKRTHRSFRRRRRHNPIAGFAGADLIKLGLGAAGGAVGTRFLTQTILGDKNTGVMGYGANALIAIGLAWAAAKFAGREVASGVAAGGLAAVILRLWSDRVSGSSAAALSGYLGDLEFSSDGLGAYIQSGFPLPTVSGGNGNYLSVPAPASWGPIGAPAGAALAPNASTAPNVNVQPGVPAGLSRFASRF